MENKYALTLTPAPRETALELLRECNLLTQVYGLSLTQAQIENLVQGHDRALEETGRVEFGEGIIKKLITAFRTSPFITQENYEETLFELQYAFYYFKGEANERIGDDELIGYMLSVFNGRAQGSLEYLTQTALPRLCRELRRGSDLHDAEAAGR